MTWNGSVPGLLSLLNGLFTTIGPQLPQMEKSQQQIFELASSRAARRIERKRIKVARAEGTYRPSRMPGAWIV